MGQDTAGTPATPSAILLVPPAALPDLIAAHDRTARSVGDMLSRLAKAGRIPQPWTHDPVARDITMRFNAYAVDGTASAYNVLLLYIRELQRVAETLRTMHAAYVAGEDVNAAAMGAL